MVVTSYGRLVTLEPKSDIARRCNVGMENGVEEVRAEELFQVVFSNFGHTAPKLPKRTVIAYETKRPLEILRLKAR